MKTNSVKIGDLISLPEVETVIRLENDSAAAQRAALSFVITADVGNHLHLLFESLLRPFGQGFFLQGDFGSGKSHFLFVLYAFFKKYDGIEYLINRHDELRRFTESGRLILPVAVSLVHFRASASLEAILVHAFEAALRSTGRSVTLTHQGAVLAALAASLERPEFARSFANEIGAPENALAGWIDVHPAEAVMAAEKLLAKSAIALPQVPLRDRKELFEACIGEVRAAGYDGAVFLVDELSEFFRSKPDPSSLNDDARTLQLLGELSSTSPLWIIAAVQESVERTGDIAQATFRKIKDRYPVRLSLSTVHIRDLIGKRLIRVKPEAESAVFGVYETFRRYFPHFSYTPALFHSIYPVHPKTLELLEGLGDLFSQHRGIVDFIHAQVGGDPSRGIDGILDRPVTELLAPDAIYYHFASRIAEFSPFYRYPSQIVPHLDGVINSTHADSGDRVLAKRLIRIIVLYTIHPTASPPTAGELAELVACMLSLSSRDANAQYITEVLLDPIVAASRFLAKNPSPAGTDATATYSITTSDDQTKILQARIDRVIREINPTDTRLFNAPLAELAESFSWPGPGLFNDILLRQVTWRQSIRTCAITVLTPGMEAMVAAKLEAMYAAGTADFGMVIALGKCAVDTRFTAVWRINTPLSREPLLDEYFACKAVLAELRPGNPADIPLIPVVKDRLRKSEAAVNALLLQRIYQGNFVNVAFSMDPAVRQVMRFDRLSELVAEELCEARYPHFKEIAPRGLPPSLRLYQRLYEEFIVAGMLSLRDARSRGLSESIETLAAPLGLIDVKSGNYLLAPQTVSNTFLAYIFGHFNSPVPQKRGDLLTAVQTGPYGLPRETSWFLFASLAQCGLISLINHNRALAPDYIKLMTIDQVESIAPGELINQAEREIILRECGFLLSQGGSDIFDLRRQREAWEAAIKFKASMTAHLEALVPQVRAVTGYAAFRHFNFEHVERVSTALRALLDEIKVSYAARDGLERFIASWRASGLAAEDITLVKQTGRFLLKHADKIVFVNHYCSHPSVHAAAEADSALAESLGFIETLLEHPEQSIIADEGERLQQSFEQCKEQYQEQYIDAHNNFHRNCAGTPLPKLAERTCSLIRKLAAIPALDCPPGTEQFIASVNAPPPKPCTRNPAEELLRSPVCSCGFQYGQTATPPSTEFHIATIDRILQGYFTIFKGTEMLEALSAQHFALRDIDPGTAKRLLQLHALCNDTASPSMHMLAELLDDTTVTAIGRALSGRVKIEKRSISSLREHLGGRRLNTARIRSIIDEWIGHIDMDSIVSIDDTPEQREASSDDTLIWQYLHSGLFTELPVSASDPGNTSRLQEMLERRFPASSLRPKLINAPTAALVAFLENEPVHRTACAAAWNILAGRIVNRSAAISDTGEKSRFIDRIEALAIDTRIAALRTAHRFASAHFPERLQERAALAAIAFDAWTDAPLKNDVLAAIDKLSGVAEEWAGTLPAVEVIPCTSPATVVIIDAIPADVWMMVAKGCKELLNRAEHRYLRLDTTGTTLDGLCSLFGFAATADPAAEFAAYNVTYTTISGDEQYHWTDQLPMSQSGTVRVLRVALFDKQVHAGIATLNSIAQQLAYQVARNIQPLYERCKNDGHRLVLTTDHGLTVSNRGLHHGSNGIFERIIFREDWSSEVFMHESHACSPFRKNQGRSDEIVV